MNHLQENHDRLMRAVVGTKWSLAAAVLATHGLHMLRCSRGDKNAFTTVHLRAFPFVVIFAFIYHIPCIKGQFLSYRAYMVWEVKDPLSL